MYQWNSWFIYLYALRLVFFMISGLIAIIFVMNSESSAGFLCDRYTALHFDEHASDEWNHCLTQIRLGVWLVYIPYTFFQFHCLQVLIKYRKAHENVEMGDDESDV